MIISFDRKLSKQAIFANGAELAQLMGLDKDKAGNRVHEHPKDKKLHVVTFDNPVLVTDNYKISQLEPALRDTVFALFGSSEKTIEYDGTALEFDQQKYKGVWGPSIDTLLFCRAFTNSDLSEARTGIEVGSGSGFISKYILDNLSGLESMTLIDFNRYAMDCAHDNIKDKRAKFFAGNAIEFMEGKKYDLIVCNPPYIPRPKSIDDNPYEGIGLLCYLVTHPKELLTENGKLIINISSLCQKLVLGEMVKDCNVNSKELDNMEVPLKVYNVLNNEVWMNYLLGKGLKKERREGYDYWQRLMITQIKR